MQYTLLQLTQSILSSMDSDEVNSITDTVEAQQVVEIIKTCYDDIASRGELPIQETLFNLTASGSAAKPTLMTKPTDIHDIRWVRYNKIASGDTDPLWVEIDFLPLNNFLQRMYQLNVSDTTVASFSHTVGSSTISFFYINDGPPNCYTSYDDNTLIFDSYDSAVDTTLQSSKTLCFGEKVVTFTSSDSFVPNLQPHQFSLLLNQAKTLAWAELKQSAHLEAKESARKNWIHLQKRKNNIPYGLVDSGPNYGRK